MHSSSPASPLCISSLLVTHPQRSPWTKMEGQRELLCRCSLCTCLSLERKGKWFSKSMCPRNTEGPTKLKFTCYHTIRKEYVSSQPNMQLGCQPHAQAAESWVPVLGELPRCPPWIQVSELELQQLSELTFFPFSAQMENKVLQPLPLTWFEMF